MLQVLHGHKDCSLPPAHGYLLPLFDTTDARRSTHCMERVVQAEQGKSKWSPGWLPLVVVLLFGVIFLALYTPLLIWSFSTAIAALLPLLALLALMLLPGLALLRLLWRAPLAGAERWALALGISGAIPPLLLLASLPLGLRWNVWLCWSFLALCGAVAFWPSPAQGASDQRLVPANWHLTGEHLLLIALTLLTIAVRLYAARDLPVGLWGDSYQHTVIAQLLVENGGIFSSWLPYAPLTTFTYHFGFHSMVAWLHWLSGVPTTRGLILVGQLQSALTVPLLYLFTRRLSGNATAGLWAALVVAVVSTLPAYYLNWGRYTQLAGQSILPALCVAWMALLDQSIEASADRRQTAVRGLVPPILLAAILTAGLVLTHYRVAVFAACFVVAYTLYLLVARVRSWAAFLRLYFAGFVAALLAVLAIAPWLLRLRQGALLRIGQQFVATNIGSDQSNKLPDTLEILSFYIKPYLLALALLGVVLLIWRRNGRGLVIVGAAALTVLAANPYFIGLTGAGIITNFAVLLAGYLLFVPLAGIGIALLCEIALRRPAAAAALNGVQLVVGAAVLLWGVGWQQHIAAPQFQLFTPADAQAVAWIRRETPPDAAFFVNSSLAYGNTLNVGTDGGWWLPLLTGRKSSLPPLTYGSEAADPPNYQSRVNRFIKTVRALPIDSPDAAEELRAAGYTYLYNGPTSNPDDEYIKPDLLARSSLYELVYDKDGVTIWRVR